MPEWRWGGRSGSRAGDYIGAAPGFPGPVAFKLASAKCQCVASTGCAGPELVRLVVKGVERRDNIYPGDNAKSPLPTGRWARVGHAGRREVPLLPPARAR